MSRNQTFHASPAIPSALYSSRSLTSVVSSVVSHSPVSSSRSLTSLCPSFRSPVVKRPFSSGPLTPKNRSFTRASQSSLVEGTSQNIFEPYGTPLPVFVTEAITVAERLSDVSVKLHESGWASLVCGRRLFVWRYKLESGMKSTAAHCKELTLPASDLAHKAELVQVLRSKELQMTSVIAVSPEGIVRYWPNIAHEGASFEAAADLQGQECYSLTNVQPLGCILATTTGSLVLVKPSSIDGQPTVLCVTLKLPQGVLAGIGRRVSSFIFGAMPTQSSEAKQLNKVLAVPEEDEKYSLYVLNGSVFQKWCLSAEEPYKLLFELELDRYLKEGFLDTLWNGNSSQLDEIKIWCLDMQLSPKGIIILTAGMNPLVSQEMFYAFGVLEEPQPTTSKVFSSFIVIKYSELIMDHDEDKLLGYRFLYPLGCDDKAYVYNSYKVICISAFSETDPDVIEFDSVENSILGAGSCGALPLLFTQSYGLLCLHPQGLEQEQESGSFHEHMKEGSISEIRLTDYSDGDLPGKMKMAICFHCNGEVDICRNLVTELLQLLGDVGNDCALDNLVVTLSLNIIDDHPLSDPRWCESIPEGDSVSSSLIILYQLDDKLKAHSHLVNFLKAYDLWDKLSVVKIKDTPMATCLVLLEHVEKLNAAKVLRKFSLEYPEIAEKVIKDVLDRRGIEVKKPLSHQDMFFREVSHVDNFFTSLLAWQDEELNKDSSNAKSIAGTIGIVNAILVGVFQVVLHFRESNKEIYSYDSNISKVEYIPWTSNEESTGIRMLLLRQHSMNVKCALNLSEAVLSDGVIFQTFADLVDIILNGFKCQLESLKGKPSYESVKEKFSREQTKLISPLLEVNQFERAAALAEKFLDFQVLVQLCEGPDSSDRLREYCRRFHSEGFPKFVFNWYLEKGKRGKLLEPPLVHEESLREFLHDHKELGWLYQMRNKDYASAQRTLKELALAEQNFLSKKKTCLSLSKLAVLSSDVPLETKNIQLEGLNFELDLIAHQEALPAKVCESLGIDLDNARVFSPEELIELYICEENSEANQYDFKIALDLLSFIPRPSGDEYIEGIRQRIWSQAILRDDWTQFDVSNPLTAIKDTIFFKMIELAFDQGVDLFEFLPPVDDIIRHPDPSLQWIVDNSSLSFFIRAAYEHFEKLSI